MAPLSPCPGRNVLIVDAEGAPALLNQRAQAWQIDRRRLFLMLAPDPAPRSPGEEGTPWDSETVAWR